jgi:enolase-phosphatase E1
VIARLRDRGVRAVLLDIEGTTTPIAFVSDVLFPFARAHLTDFLQDARGSQALDDLTRRLAAEHADDRAGAERPPEWHDETADQALDSLSRYVTWLMDRDRKSPGLKLLQGLIWERGYQAGVLRGQVFSDVPHAIRRWRADGIDVAIYSSGSELAQRRLFESTEHGNLTPLIAGFFDTAVGAKTVAASYRHIVEALSRRPEEVLFVSDVAAELAAARTAGLQVVLSVRPGDTRQPDVVGLASIRSFDEL